MTPSWTRAQIPVMPKGRYQIMTDYMPKVGQYGLDMMYRTCTVQTNLDFSSEADMVKKLRVSVALQPVATALFANSPFTEGKPNGFLSFRSEIWRDTDNARSGMIPWAFENGMGSSAGSITRWTCRCISSSAARPISTSRDRRSAISLREKSGISRRAPDAVRLGQSSFDDLPEVRLKRYLEMRGADGVPWDGCRRCRRSGRIALRRHQPGCGVDIAKNWNAGERQALRDDVPRFGFKARIKGRYLFEIAKECVALAHSGLRRRGRVDYAGRDESRHLEPLERIIDSGRAPPKKCWRNSTALEGLGGTGL